MEEQGLLKKTHGGAIPISKVRTFPPSPTKRYSEASKYENAIAKQAVSFIEEGDTVFIGSARIHYCMVKHLPSHFPFTVVTNSLKIAESLQDKSHIDTYLLGGKLKPSGSITDSLASEFARQFTIDLCFATGGGVSEKGISTSTPEVASFGRAISDISRRSICLAPHEKVGVNYFAKVISLQNIDLVITDEEADRDALQRIEQAGVKVMIANVDEE
jgi:DeoR/GlpR family transcriptional regulator of sugar metabolism